VDGYFKTIKAAIMNIGATPLSNFTIFADTHEKQGFSAPPKSEAFCA